MTPQVAWSAVKIHVIFCPGFFFVFLFFLLLIFFHVSGAEHTSTGTRHRPAPQQNSPQTKYSQCRYNATGATFLGWWILGAKARHFSRSLLIVNALRYLETSVGVVGGDYGNDTSEIIYGVDGYIGAPTIPGNNILRTSDISYSGVHPDADPTQKAFSKKWQTFPFGQALEELMTLQKGPHHCLDW